MKGKLGLIVGAAAGYVLGTRAGRERFEQIKTQAAKVWDLDPVQNSVEKAKAFGSTAAKVVPGAVWDGAKRVGGAASGSGSAQERAKRAADAAKSSAKDVADAVDLSVSDAKAAGASSTDGDVTQNASSGS